jgi:uncharacterized delta-60 repeat protein
MSQVPRLEMLEDRCLRSAGQLDTTFGSGGIVTTAFGTGKNKGGRAWSVLVQTDGKIVGAGDNAAGSFALARYTSSGSLDSTFGSGGKVTTSFSGTAVGLDSALYPNAGTANDGKIVLAGYVNSGTNANNFALARYNPNGTLDATFGNKGKVTTALNGNDQARAVVIQPDGRIIEVGLTDINSPGGATEFALVRYNVNGTLDTTFGTGGKVLTQTSPGANCNINDVALQADGKIVVAGTAPGAPGGPSGSFQFCLARYNSDGTLDTTFGPNHTGIVQTVTGTATNSDNEAQAVVIQSDGKIVAGGDAQIGTYQAWALVRYNSDGSLDSAFGSGGIVTQAIGSLTDNPIDSIEDIALQSDGKIVVAGDHSSSTTADEFALGRFNGADGSLDTTFNSSGIVTTQIGVSSHAYGVVLQPSDGKIVAAGKTNSGSETDMALARYLNDGMPAGPVAALQAGSAPAISAGAVDSLFADMRAVAILLSGDAPSNKH